MVYPGAGCAARRSASVYNLSSHASSSGARGDTTTIASPVVGLLWTSQWTTVRRYVTAYLLVRLLWRRARRDAGVAGGARNMLAQLARVRPGWEERRVGGRCRCRCWP